MSSGMPRNECRLCTAFLISSLNEREMELQRQADQVVLKRERELTDQFDKLHFCVVATRHTGIRLLLLRRVQAETLHAECCCSSNK